MKRVFNSAEAEWRIEWDANTRAYFITKKENGGWPWMPNTCCFTFLGARFKLWLMQRRIRGKSRYWFYAK